jgi:hypothetical protein
MAPPSIRKTFTSLSAVVISTVFAEAQTSFTLAAGYVQVTVPGGTLGAISATLQSKSDHTSNATVNNDWTPLDDKGTPSPLDDDPAQQTLTVTGAGWTAGQWTTSGFLCYAADSNDGEESFLILANTSDTITIQADFDLLDGSRSIPTTSTISLRRAQTVGSLFGFGAGNTDFTSSDKVYLWNGNGWTTYFVNAAFQWAKSGSFFSANNDVIFPDEGLFIQRNDPSDLTLTFFGDVPGKAQVTTMPGPKLQFVSTRYPVGTTIGGLGFHNLTNWQTGNSGDLVYVWNGTSWTTYFYKGGGNWGKAGSFFNHENDAVLPDSAVFVSRKSSATLAESPNTHALPYTP